MKDLAFVHVIKTGGTSIEAALHDHLFAYEHMTAYRMRQKYTQNNLFYFAFIRNPWDFLVSHYEYNNLRHRHVILSDREFKPFVLRSTLPNLRFNPDHTFYDPEMLDPYNWIVDTDHNVIVDFVGKFESLNEDFERLCKIAGITDVRLKHLNASNRRPYQEYYDNETREAVAEAYSNLINFGGYTF